MGTIVPAKFCTVQFYDVGYFMYMYILVYNYKYTVSSFVHKWKYSLVKSKTVSTTYYICGGNTDLSAYYYIYLSTIIH